MNTQLNSYQQLLTEKRKLKIQCTEMELRLQDQLEYASKNMGSIAFQTLMPKNFLGGLFNKAEKVPFLKGLVDGLGLVGAAGSKINWGSALFTILPVLVSFAGPLIKGFMSKNKKEA